MTGPALAAAAGLGFGVFQTLNRRAVGGMSDAYLATFLQLATALGVLVVATLATEDLGLLGDATAVSLVCFSVAGLIHFAVGWTFLNMSQMRIGAARTSPLLATTPVFGAVIAILVLNEVPAASSGSGVALVTAGALVVSLERVSEDGWGISWRDALPGLATALAWATSPLLIKEGLEGPALAAPRPDARDGRGPARLRGRAAAAAAGSTGPRSARGSRWPSSSSPASWSASPSGRAGRRSTTRASPSSSPSGSSPSRSCCCSRPVLMGRHVERVTAQIWLGAALVVVGGLVLVLLS